MEMQCTVPGITDRRPAPSFLPTTAALELTYCCNHLCRFCSCPWSSPDSSFEQKRELTVAEWCHVIDRLAGMGVVNFSFTGGEPLLKEGFCDILRHAGTRDVEHIASSDGKLVSRPGRPNLFLISNGRDMNENVLHMCRDLGVNVMFSLPGLETYSWHTGVDGSAQTVLGWIHAAHDAEITTTAGVTVTRRNLYELYETIAAALLNGADALLLNRFLVGGRGVAFRNDLELSLDELQETLKVAESVLSRAHRPGSLGTELPFCCVPSDQEFNWLKIGTRCAAAKGFFVVDPSGYVRVCNQSTDRLCHVDSIETLKVDPYWRRFALRDYLPESCLPCAHTDKCDGGCREAAHVSGGSPDSRDPIVPREIPQTCRRIANSVRSTQLQPACIEEP